MQLKILASPQLLSKEGYRDVTEMVGGRGGSAVIIDNDNCFGFQLNFYVQLVGYSKY